MTTNPTPQPTYAWQETFEGGAANDVITLTTAPNLADVYDDPTFTDVAAEGSLAADLTVIDTFNRSPNVFAVVTGGGSAVGFLMRFPQAAVDNGTASIVVTSLDGDQQFLGQFEITSTARDLFGLAEGNENTLTVGAVGADVASLGQTPYGEWLRFEVDDAGAWEITSQGAVVGSGSGTFAIDSDGFLAISATASGFPGATYAQVDHLYVVAAD